MTFLVISVASMKETLERDLEAAENRTLFRPLTFGAAAGKVRLFVVQLKFHIATEIPVESQAPGFSHAGSSGGISKDGERVLIDV